MTDGLDSARQLINSIISAWDLEDKSKSTLLSVDSLIQELSPLLSKKTLTNDDIAMLLSCSALLGMHVGVGLTNGESMLKIGECN